MANNDENRNWGSCGSWKQKSHTICSLPSVEIGILNIKHIRKCVTMQWKHAYFDKDRGHFLFSCLFHNRQVENNKIWHEKKGKILYIII